MRKDAPFGSGRPSSIGMGFATVPGVEMVSTVIWATRSPFRTDTRVRFLSAKTIILRGLRGRLSISLTVLPLDFTLPVRLHHELGSSSRRPNIHLEDRAQGSLLFHSGLSPDLPDLSIIGHSGGTLYPPLV